MRALLDFILPPRCRLCDASTIGETTPWVCQQCWLAIDFVRPPLCEQCGQPLAAPPEGIASAMHRCGACITRPPPYARARAVGLYQDTLRDIIHAMKYQRVYGLVRPLAELLYAQYAWHWGHETPEVLIPIPLHRAKLRQREFDQALALARCLSERTGVPLWADVLVRHRATVSQVGLTAAQRRQNVRGAFHLKAPHTCAGKAVLLIDDVYTTGATIRECARLLQHAEVRWVSAYTVARVP